jgi:hypothetical protein
MRIILWFVMAGVCAAETSVTPPWIGSVRDCAGRLHRVFGVGGAFVVERVADDHFLPSTLSAASRQTKANDRLPHYELPGPAGDVQRMGPGWLAAWPYAIRLTAGGAKVYRLPVPACGGRP